MEPTSTLKRLGEMLRSLREDQGVTGKELANSLHYSQPTISRIEAGTSGALNWETVEKICDALRGDEMTKERLRRQHELALLDPRSYIVVQSSGIPAWQNQFAALESTALLYRIFQNTVIPGLLQTPSYADAVFRQVGVPEEDLSEAIHSRSQRQLVLNDPRRRFVFVLMDTAIHSVRTTVQEHASQLDLLLSRAVAANVSLHIVDSRRTVPVSLANPFTILDRKYVTAETTIKELTATSLDEIQLYEEAFNDALAHALSHDESCQYVRSVISDFEDRPQ